MAPHEQLLQTRRRGGKELPAGGKGAAGLSVLGGVVALAFLICIIRLTLLLIATSSNGRVQSGGRSISSLLENPRYELPIGDKVSEDPRYNISNENEFEWSSRISKDDQARHHEAPAVDEEEAVLVKNSTTHVLVKNSTTQRARRVLHDNGPYHSRNVFLRDYQEMTKKLKVFVYPSKRDRYRHIFMPVDSEPGGNYASEAYFKKALVESGMVTKNPADADFFFMPFSITRMRNDPRVGVGRIQGFIEEYMNKVVHKWPYWNRTGGADHFYVACHSVSRSALERVEFAQLNAIQVVCSSSYHVRGFIPHKDVPMPQIWPRKGEHPGVQSTNQRSTLAFYAGGANSPVRAKVVQTWKEDSAVRVYGSRISTSYSEALLSSKFCLHIKGYEVNTARLADALFHGCVPVVIANYYELPFDSVLNWSKFSVIVTTNDIPRLKDILSGISYLEYKAMHSLVLQARRHFQWHSPPQEYDAFFMVMYQLWRRRHILKYKLH